MEKVDSNQSTSVNHVEQSRVNPEKHTALVEDSAPTPVTSSSTAIGEGRKALVDETSEDDFPYSQKSESLTNGTTPDTPTKAESGNIWGSWRRDSLQNGRNEPASASTSGYQRAGRGRGMKVLKPARLNTSRSNSAAQPPLGFDAAPSRFSDATKKNGQASATEGQEHRSPANERRSFSSEGKTPLQSATPKSRTSNPIGGASAFGWLNSSQPKPSSSTAD